VPENTPAAVGVFDMMRQNQGPKTKGSTMIELHLTKQRAEYLLERIKSGGPIAPSGPDHWSDDDLLALAGMAVSAVTTRDGLYSADKCHSNESRKLLRDYIDAAVSEYSTAILSAMAGTWEEQFSGGDMRGTVKQRTDKN
jgi:hypothetical protein